MTKAQALGRRDFLRRSGVGGGYAWLAGIGALGSACGAGGARDANSVAIVGTAGNTTLSIEALMSSRGYLQEFGLEPRYLHLSDGTRIMGALLGGSADLAVGTGFSQVLPAIEKGGELKIVAGASLLPSYAVYSTRPDIQSLKDLEGRTVGTGSPGALLHQLIVAVLKKKGVDASKVNFVSIGSGGDVFRAVVAGTVDAGPAEIDVYERQEQYGVHSLTDGNLWTELPEYTFQGTYTTDRVIREKRDLLVRVLAAYAKLYRFISSPGSKDAFVEARVATFKNMPAQDVVADAEFQWNFYQENKSIAVDLVLSEERIDFMQRLNIDLGIQKALLPVERVADMSLAREALALLA